MGKYIVLPTKRVNKLPDEDHKALLRIIAKLNPEGLEFIAVDKREIYADAVTNIIEKGERIKAELDKPIHGLEVH